MKSLSIPNSVTYIFGWVFDGCSTLTSLLFEDGSETLVIDFNYWESFQQPPIETLYLGRNIQFSSNSPFCNDTSLKSLTIGDAVTTISRSAFEGSTGLTSLNLGKVETIGDYAFRGCSSLTSLNTGNNLTTIGQGAFINCSGMSSITIGNGVTTIGQDAFNGCNSLNTLTIGNSVKTIGFGAFENCNNLQSVTALAVSPPSISEGTFSSYSANLYVALGNKTAYMEATCWKKFNTVKEYAIIDNIKYEGLTSSTVAVVDGRNSKGKVCIPEKIYAENGNEYVVTDINARSFNECTNLSEVSLPQTITSIGEYAFSECVSLKELTIPNSVTSIDQYAFSGCNGLKDISIGDGIKEISTQAFANCQNLADVYCYAVKYPTTASDAFLNSYIDYAVLHVPAEGVEPYSKQVPWSGFRRIISIEAPKPSEITLSNAGYSTYYDEYFDTALPAGVKASVVTSVSDSKLTYKVIADGSSDGIVPAGTAVLLQGKNRSADSYTLTPTESTTNYTGENLLHGSDVATTTSADGDCMFYKLAYGPSGTKYSTTLGWFWGEDEGKPFAIEGHKAWLAIPKSAAVKSRPLFYSIDGNAIELKLIEEVASDEDKGEWYDLQGRRVENPTQRGIYIRSGKKVFIK